MNAAKDQATSYVRTGVPVAVGAFLTWALHKAGIVLDGHDSAVALLVVNGAVTWLYYVLVRVLETYWPTGGYLLGIAKKPAYDGPRPGPLDERLRGDRGAVDTRTAVLIVVVVLLAVVLGGAVNNWFWLILLALLLLLVL